MARMDRMEPKVLTTMMTAFACSNIAPETDLGYPVFVPLTICVGMLERV